MTDPTVEPASATQMPQVYSQKGNGTNTHFACGIMTKLRCRHGVQCQQAVESRNVPSSFCMYAISLIVLHLADALFVLVADL